MVVQLCDHASVMNAPIQKHQGVQWCRMSAKPCKFQGTKAVASDAASDDARLYVGPQKALVTTIDLKTHKLAYEEWWQFAYQRSQQFFQKCW